MAKWISISKPKVHGGLGILNTSLMKNQCLITKWIWKIEKGSNELWYKILQAKYMRKKGFFNSKSYGSSQFWKGLHKVKHLFQWGRSIMSIREIGLYFGMTLGWGICLSGFSLTTSMPFAINKML